MLPPLACVRRAAAILMVIAIAVSAAPAHGQSERDLRISQDDFELHCRELDLSPAQREAAEKMYTDYGREFDDAVKAYNELANWMWSHTDHGWYGGEPRPEFVEALTATRLRREPAQALGLRELETRYFDGLLRVAAGWELKVDSLERRQLRQRMCKDSIWHKDLIDLIPIVHEVQPRGWTDPAVDQALLEYETELDRLLRQYDEGAIARNRETRVASRALSAAKKSGADREPHLEALVNAMVSLVGTSAQILSLNLQTAARLQSLLPDPALADALHRKLHWHMYGEDRQTPNDFEWQSFPDVAASLAKARINLNDDRDRLAAVELIWQQWRAERDAMTPRLRAAKDRRASEEGDRQYYELHFGGKRDEAEALYERRESEWQNALKPWIARCAAACKAVDQIMESP